MIDDHSRLFLASRAYPTAKAADVVDVFRSAVDLHGAAGVLALRQRRRVHRHSPGWQGALAGRDGAPGDHRQELAALPPPDLRQGRAPAPDAEALPGRQAPRRRSQSCRASSTPSRTTTTRSGPTGPWAGARPCRPTAPGSRPGRPCAEPETHFRIRHDKVDTAGTVTLRHDSKLHHIGIGRAHKGKPVKLLIADRDIRDPRSRDG